MARAVQLPRALPRREGEPGPARPRINAPARGRATSPARDRELVPDQVMRALMKELEVTAPERQQKPARSAEARPLAAPESWNAPGTSLRLKAEGAAPPPGSAPSPNRDPPPRRMLYTVKVPQAAVQACLAVLDEELLRTLAIGLAGKAQSRITAPISGIGPGHAGSRRARPPASPSISERPTPRPLAGAAWKISCSSAASAPRMKRSCSSSAVADTPAAWKAPSSAGPISTRWTGARSSSPIRSWLFPSHPWPDERRRYSRVIGGLGTDVWGEVAWPRLRDARWCLVGAGRGGTALAMLLAQQGALYLTIIDPDQVAEHNLDGLPAPRRWSAPPRLQLLAFLLQRFRPEMTAYPVPHSLVTLPSMEAMWEADLLVSLVNSDQARLVASATAAAYLKPHLDIGQSVVAASGRERELGVDVRLIIPGQGCLQCIGGAGELSLLTRHELPDPHAPRGEAISASSAPAAWPVSPRSPSGWACGWWRSMLVGVRTESAWLRLVQQGERMELRRFAPGPAAPVLSVLPRPGWATPLPSSAGVTGSRRQRQRRRWRPAEPPSLPAVKTGQRRTLVAVGSFVYRSPASSNAARRKSKSQP